jgi:hypothetical protein
LIVFALLMINSLQYPDLVLLYILEIGWWVQKKLDDMILFFTFFSIKYMVDHILLCVPIFLSYIALPEYNRY